MIQIIPRIAYHGLWAASTQWMSVSTGQGSLAGSALNGARQPVSVAGTFRHLVIGSQVTHPTLTVTLLVNGVATALTATLGAADALVSAADAEVAVTAGDDVGYALTGTSQAAYGLGHLSACIEFEGAAGIYGIGAWGDGGFAVPVGRTIIGGALGTGVWELFTGQPQSNTYSIGAAAGAVTRLDAVTFAGAPGAGAWHVRLRKNGVTQDGTGGTVDTTCTLTGAATRALSTFSLPLALADLLDFHVELTGASLPAGALAHVAVGLAYVPTEVGTFLLCGGSNDAIRGDGPDWKWTRGDQLVATEALAEAPVGPHGFQARGLYVRRAGAPSPGNSSVYTLRRSGTDTAIALTIAEVATTGVVTGAEAFASGETATIQATPVGVPLNNGFYWGLAATAETPAAPVYTTTTRAIRRLRRAPHVTNDHTRVFLRRFELDLERGQGLVTGQGSDPIVLLRISRDGGQTWGEEIRMAAGEIGAYQQRVLARRLGQARDTVFEVTVSDPIAWSLVGAWLDVEPGAH